jgi:hypothetical protein
MQVFFLIVGEKEKKSARADAHFPKVFHSGGDPEINGVRQDCPST